MDHTKPRGSEAYSSSQGTSNLEQFGGYSNFQRQNSLLVKKEAVRNLRETFEGVDKGKDNSNCVPVHNSSKIPVKSRSGLPQNAKIFDDENKVCALVKPVTPDKVTTTIVDSSKKTSTVAVGDSEKITAGIVDSSEKKTTVIIDNNDSTAENNITVENVQNRLSKSQSVIEKLQQDLPTKLSPEAIEVLKKKYSPASEKKVVKPYPLNISRNLDSDEVGIPSNSYRSYSPQGNDASKQNHAKIPVQNSDGIVKNNEKFVESIPQGNVQNTTCQSLKNGNSNRKKFMSEQKNRKYFEKQSLGSFEKEQQSKPARVSWTTTLLQKLSQDKPEKKVKKVIKPNKQVRFPEIRNTSVEERFKKQRPASAPLPKTQPDSKVTQNKTISNVEKADARPPPLSTEKEPVFVKKSDLLQDSEKDAYANLVTKLSSGDENCPSAACDVNRNSDKEINNNSGQEIIEDVFDSASHHVYKAVPVAVEAEAKLIRNLNFVVSSEPVEEVAIEQEVVKTATNSKEEKGSGLKKFLSLNLFTSPRRNSLDDRKNFQKLPTDDITPTRVCSKFQESPKQLLETAFISENSKKSHDSFGNIHLSSSDENKQIRTVTGPHFRSKSLSPIRKVPTKPRPCTIPDTSLILEERLREKRQDYRHLPSSESKHLPFARPQEPLPHNRSASAREVPVYENVRYIAEHKNEDESEVGRVRNSVSSNSSTSTIVPQENLQSWTPAVDRFQRQTYSASPVINTPERNQRFGGYNSLQSINYISPPVNRQSQQNKRFEQRFGGYTPSQSANNASFPAIIQAQRLEGYNAQQSLNNHVSSVTRQAQLNKTFEGYNAPQGRNDASSPVIRQAQQNKIFEHYSSPENVNNKKPTIKRGPVEHYEPFLIQNRPVPSGRLSAPPISNLGSRVIVPEPRRAVPKPGLLIPVESFPRSQSVSPNYALLKPPQSLSVSSQSSCSPNSSASSQSHLRNKSPQKLNREQIEALYWEGHRMRSMSCEQFTPAVGLRNREQDLKRTSLPRHLSSTLSLQPQTANNSNFVRGSAERNTIGPIKSSQSQIPGYATPTIYENMKSQKNINSRKSPSVTPQPIFKRGSLSSVDGRVTDSPSFSVPKRVSFTGTEKRTSTDSDVFLPNSPRSPNSGRDYAIINRPLPPVPSRVAYGAISPAKKRDGVYTDRGASPVSPASPQYANRWQIQSESESGSEAEVQRILFQANRRGPAHFRFQEEEWTGEGKSRGSGNNDQSAPSSGRDEEVRRGGGGRPNRREDPRRHTLSGDHHQGGTLARSMDLESPLPRGYPPPSSAMLFDDDPGIMSEVETSSTGFRRGGKQRSSLPVVRTPSKTLERPLGLVFLQYRNETKRALLPNEITSIDTVKALFVRSFPKQLTMDYLDSPHVKIYIHDSSKDMFYELEDHRSHLREIRDRSVLRLFEAADVNGGVIPGTGIGVVSPAIWDQDQSYFSEPEFDSEYQHQHIHKTKTSKSQPYYMTHSYPPGGAQPGTVPRGGTLLRAYSPGVIPPLSADRLKTLPQTGAPGYEDPYYSQYAPRSGSITPVIDEEASDTELIDESYSLYGVKLPGTPRSIPPPTPRSPFPAPAVIPYDTTRIRVEHMERQLANLTGLVQKALIQTPTPREFLQVPASPRDANYRSNATDEYDKHSSSSSASLPGYRRKYY